MGKRFQLPLQTADLIAGFMVWVMLSSLLPFIKQDVAIPADLIALVTAIPVVLGSVLRIPFGYLTGLFGARVVFTTSFIALIAPVWLLSEARTCEELLVAGTFLGIAGAVFSVGVTSLPRYYPRDKQGFVNGVYGFGNMGTALTTWLAPLAAVSLGWRVAAKLYLVLLGVFVVVNLVAGDRAETPVKTPIKEQFRAIRSDAHLWVLSLFYFVTFGAFVALTVFLPHHLVSTYHMTGVEAGCATSVFIVTAAVLRVLGGWLGDRFDCRRMLIVVFAVIGATALAMAFAPNVAAFLGLVYLVGIACGIGNGVVFKLVPSRFSATAGLANGIVSMMGGLGGFFPPLVVSASMSAFATNAPAFALLTACSAVCLVATRILKR